MPAAWVNKPLENKVRRGLGSIFRTLVEKHSSGPHLKSRAVLQLLLGCCWDVGWWIQFYCIVFAAVHTTWYDISLIIIKPVDKLKSAESRLQK